MSPEDRGWIKDNRPALLTCLAREPVEQAVAAAVAAAVDRYDMDPEGPPVQMAHLAVVFVEGLEPVAVPVDEWDRLRASVAGWNEEHRPKSVEEAEQARQEKKRSKGRKAKR